MNAQMGRLFALGAERQLAKMLLWNRAELQNGPSTTEALKRMAWVLRW